jgi:hypothetical protein
MHRESPGYQTEKLITFSHYFAPRRAASHLTQAISKGLALPGSHPGIKFATRIWKLG